MKKVKRLFSEFRPEHYDLYLAPNRESMTFSGTVKILGARIGKPSQRLTLHQKGLKIKSAKVTKNDKKRGLVNVEVSRINCHEGFNEVRLHTAEMVYPGEYTIELDFSGRITDQMHGIYPCYFNHNGQKKCLIATQFESHHAREAFPCVDEPEAKATFDLSLLTPAGETIIANTPVKSQETTPKQATTMLTSFETTPKMSSYLLAFAYGDMVSVDGQTKSGVKVSCYGTPLAEGLLDYSLQAGIKSVEFFEDYFKVAYPLAKLDIAALPDFSSGAMENWGLMTFRESVMLVDPEHTGVETKQVVSLVVAHEVSHQWFGNLVTMRWWDDLWLNESFANLMEYRAVDEIEPQWNIFEQFVGVETNMAMRRDALAGVQPVRVDVGHPDEINSLFDPAIVYAKGGNILRMLMHFIGEDNFRKGLSAYFSKHAYGNTSADDLWEALSGVSGEDVGAFMKNWLSLPGYPVVDVAHQPGSDSMSLSQKRLVIGEDKSETIWSVPLAANAKLDRNVLSAATDDFKLSTGEEPLLLNHHGRSYFIPRYLEQKHRTAIIQALTDGRIDAIDRLLLLLSGSIMESALLAYTVDNLKLTAALAGELEEAVWSAVAGVLGSARRLVAKSEKSEDDLNRFIAELVAKSLERVGWETVETDSAQFRRLRNLIIGLAAGARVPEVTEKGLAMFQAFSQPFDLPAEVRGNVYFIGVRFGDQKDFKKLIDLYKTIDNADEKDEICSALASTREPEQIKILLELLKSEYVRAQDLPRWFAYMMNNAYAAKDTWQWLRDNWEWIVSKYGNDKSFDAFPRYAAAAFSRPEELKKYSAFFEPKKNDPALSRVIELGVAEIAGRVDWRVANETAVKDYLAKN